MRIVFVTATVILAFAASCKKKDSATINGSALDPGHGQPGGTTTGGSTTGGVSSPVVLTTTATSWHGFLVTASYTNLVGGDIYTTQGAYATFSAQPMTSPSDQGAVYSGKVSLNDDSLFFDPGGFGGSYAYYLAANSGTLDFSHEKWAFTGLGALPTFTFANTIARPSADGSVLPSTISKSAGTSFTLQNVVNFTSSFLYITDGTSNVNSTMILPVNKGKNVVTLSPSNLSAFSTGTTGVIILQMENAQTGTCAGKNFQFSKQEEVYRSVTIVP